MISQVNDQRCKVCNAFLSMYNVHKNGLCSPCNTAANLSFISVDKYDSGGKLKQSPAQYDANIVKMVKGFRGQL